MKSITIVSEDKVGLLADISYILAKAHVNIESINVEVISGKAIINLSMSDRDKGKEVLEGAGFKIEEMNSVVVKLTDKPGELNRISTKLAREGVNIQSMKTLSRDGKTTVLALSVDHPRKAEMVLEEYLMAKDQA